jgi:hypothetical protein
MRWSHLEDGALFAMALITGARSQPLASFSTRRTAAWGALAALGLPSVVITADVIEKGLRAYVQFGLLRAALEMLAFAAALGGGLAAVTLTVARRSTSDDYHRLADERK